MAWLAAMIRNPEMAEDLVSQVDGGEAADERSIRAALDGAMRLALPLVKEYTGLNVPMLPAMTSLKGLRGLGNTRVRERRFAELNGIGRVAAQQEVAVGMASQRRQFAPDIA